MTFTLPALPYAPDALAPVISQETISFHYGKHEKGYIDTLNELIKETPYAEMTIEEIIKEADGKIFNNASQAWNHIFYFFQFSPDRHGKSEPGGDLCKKIDEQFGSFEEFKKRFEEAGKTLFGSGWVWLSEDGAGNLVITQGTNAANPMVEDLRPIMTFDVWEHAYYLDYQNRRPDYLHNLWDIIDWDIIETRYSSGR